MTIGTSHFISLGAAQRYYAPYEGGIEDAVHAANRKLDAGEIHIGKPSLKVGETLSVVPGEGRYQITVEDSPETVAAIIAGQEGTR